MATTGHEERFRHLYAEESVARLARLRQSALMLHEAIRAGEDDAVDGPTRDTIESMFREAHTLKGGAAVVGFGDVSRIAHALEDVLGHLGEGHGRASPDLADGLLAAVDALRSIIDLAVRGQPHTADADAALAALQRSQDR